MGKKILADFLCVWKWGERENEKLNINLYGLKIMKSIKRRKRKVKS